MTDHCIPWVSMELHEATIHSFIIRLWLEETAEETGPVKWRGYITHIPSGKQLYLKSLDEISHFIQAYLSTLDTPFEIG